MATKNRDLIFNMKPLLNRERATDCCQSRKRMVCIRLGYGATSKEASPLDRFGVGLADLKAR